MNSSQIEIKCLANGMGPYKDLDAEAAPVESGMSVWRDSELAS